MYILYNIYGLRNYVSNSKYNKKYFFLFNILRG